MISIEQQRKEADSLLERGQLQEAARVFDSICMQCEEDIDARLMLAAVLGELGDIDAAFENIARVIQLDPRCAEAYLIEANLLCSKNRLTDGFHKAREAVAVDPGFDEAWTLLARLGEQLGDYKVALEAFRNLTRLMPAQVDVWWNRARMHLQLGQISDSIEALERTLELDSDHDKAMTLLGALYGQKGRFKEAEDFSRRALRLDPKIIDARVNLARALKEQRNYTEAKTRYRNALDLDASVVDAWAGLGDVHGILMELDEAEYCYRKALELEPGVVAYRQALAGIARLKGDFPFAEKLCREVLAEAPESAEVCVELGDILLAQGDTEESINFYQRARRLDSKNLAAVAGESGAHERLKDYDKALSILLPHVEAGSADHRLALSFANLSRHFGHHADAARVINDLLQDPELGEFERIELNFCIGRLYDEMGSYDKAFEYIDAANKAKLVDFDPVAHRDFVSDIISCFDSASLKRFPNSDATSEKPVFIVGMPRSGTSLVEQVLASHPEIHGAGELAEIGMMVARLSGIYGASYPAWLGRLEREKVDSFAREHLALLDDMVPGAKLVTDKMPQNFLYLGVIQLLFPEARIIHCRRNPLDSCLSCYFRNFAGDLAFSYSLEHLADYYHDYQRLMKHWHEVLDLNIFDIQYEDLVEDLEGNARLLLDYLGLTWDDKCLCFHESKRVVRTASYDQVRQPIYSTSVGKWKHYRDDIGVLMRKFGE